MSKVTVDGDQITIIGKAVNPSDYGIDGRVSDGEAAVIVNKRAIIEAIRLHASQFELRQCETWRDVVRRVGAAQGLRDECLAAFDAYMENPESDPQACAREALLDWDALV